LQKNANSIFFTAISETVKEEEAGDKEGNGQSESGPNESAGPNEMQTEMDQPEELLATFSLDLGPNLKLYIECAKGRSGQKTIEISVVFLVLTVRSEKHFTINK
jgi:hypothetical protein